MKLFRYIIVLIIMFFSFNIKTEALVAVVDVDDALNVRSQANIFSNVVASIPAKTELSGVVELDKTGNGCTSNWYAVSYDGKVGFVCGYYLKVTDTSNDVGKVSCVENNDPLNIWSDVNRTSRLKQLSCNVEMNILQRDVLSNSKCAKWYSVESNGVVGYACGNYIYDDSTINNDNKNEEEKDEEKVNVGKSTIGDNIYEKTNYEEAVAGDGFISCYEDTGDLSMRSTPGGGSTGDTVSCGGSVKINDIKESTGKCGYYYNITNMETNKSGWVCGYFVNTTKLSKTAMNYYSEDGSLEKYYEELRTRGFPDSYLPYLAEIHARHPNWNFEIEKIDLDFDTVVLNESYNGRNLVQGAAFNYNYRSMGLDTYNILTDRFDDYDTEVGWYNASTEAVAFYLDPRTYLNEKYIFAFESLYYTNEHDSGMISKILSNQTFWPTVYTNFTSNVVDDLIKATEKIGISAVHIASRIRQEISGISVNDPRLGGLFTYNDVQYSGYYNFFNIRVYGSNKIVNGMVYAMNNGWNSPYNGLYGGSSFIYNDYVGINQDTMYYEKFDVSTDNGHYTHQYMQNLAAVAQETNTTFNSYIDLENYFDKEIVFTIPVYNNMSNYAVTSPRVGNPNNYLKDLKVDGSTINGFSYDKYDYEITLPAGTESIKVDAIKINGDAKVSGLGDAVIDSNEKLISIVVTAQNNRTRTYNLNITRLEEEKEEDIVDLNTIMNNSGVKYNDSYIFGISENTNINSFIENIKDVSDLNSVSVKDKNGDAKTGIFKTGDVVTVNNSKESKNYTVLIYGDINGDGKINKDDCLAILRQINGYTNLTEVYKESADANKDGKIDKDDCLAILRQLNGYTDLNK